MRWQKWLIPSVYIIYFALLVGGGNFYITVSYMDRANDLGREVNIAYRWPNDEDKGRVFTLCNSDRLTD